MLRAVRASVLPVMTARQPIEAWIVDDTGFPKKGKHSVGVARQYCGQLGKQDNCQVAVSLSVATGRASLPVAWRLYLPTSWAEGAAEKLSSRFAALGVRPAHGDHRRSEPRPEQWLLIVWPHDDAERTRFWFSTLPAGTPIERLAYLAKLRWLIERDYQELKQEHGLGHYEGRGWRGFHHHAALCVAAYGFLVAEKAALPPSAGKTTRLVKAPALPAGYRALGSANPNRTPRAAIDRHTATPDRPRPGEKLAPMSMLYADHSGPSQ